MATPTDKSVQEEDEVRTEEVDPAKPTVQDLNQMRTSGETMERGSTSVASDQNPFFLPPQEDTLTLLGGIQYGTEEETFGLLGFSSTIHTSGQMMDPGSTTFASDQNCLVDSNPNTSALSLSIQDQESDQSTENQNNQQDSQERSVASAQRMMPHLRPSVRPYQQELPVTPFQVPQQMMMMPHPYQQERPVAPFQMFQQRMMPHLIRPSVPPYQQERPVASAQNEFNQPFGMQRGKRKVYEVGESSSSRKRQNVADLSPHSSQQGRVHEPGGLMDQLLHLHSLYSRGQAPRVPMTYNEQHGFSSSQNNLRHPFGMRQQHLWQIQAPGVSEGYQEYLERLGRSSGGSAVNQSTISQRQHYSSPHAPPMPELNPNVFLSHGFSAGRYGTTPQTLDRLFTTEQEVKVKEKEVEVNTCNLSSTKEEEVNINTYTKEEEQQFHQGGLGENVQPQIHQGERGGDQNLQQQLHQGGRGQHQFNQGGIGQYQHQQPQFHQGGRGRGENVQPHLHQGERGGDQNLQQQFHQGGRGGGL
ncbi:hypothetical protein Bca101_019531 [Brassica carinata]